jgi:hypothetical protein
MNFLDMYYPNMSQADRRRFNLARQQELMNRQLRTQTSGLPMYRDSLLGRGAVGPLQRRDAMQSAVADMQAAMAAASAPAAVAPATGLLSAADVRPMARPYDFSDVTDEISRKPQPARGLLGRIGEGLRGAGQELGGLFQGPEGQLRARELSKALMTGPSRIPVSFGQSLVEGLAAGGEAVSQAEAAQRASIFENMKSAMELEKLQLELEEKRGKKNGEGEKRKREKTLSVVSSIDDALEIVDDYGRLAAGVGSLMRFLPETPARRLELALDSVKANIGFEALQQMRDASKTGGALGQVTERELQFLQRTIAPIEGDLSPEDLRRNLMKVRINMLATAYGVIDPKTGEARRIESASDYDEILKGNLRVNYEEGSADTVAAPSATGVIVVSPEDME